MTQDSLNTIEVVSGVRGDFIMRSDGNCYYNEKYRVFLLPHILEEVICGMAKSRRHSSVSTLRDIVILPFLPVSLQRESYNIFLNIMHGFCARYEVLFDETKASTVLVNSNVLVVDYSVQPGGKQTVQTATFGYGNLWNGRAVVRVSEEDRRRF